MQNGITGYFVHLYSDTARCFNQLECALYRNVIIKEVKCQSNCSNAGIFSCSIFFVIHQQGKTSVQYFDCLGMSSDCHSVGNRIITNILENVRQLFQDMIWCKSYHLQFNEIYQNNAISGFFKQCSSVEASEPVCSE